MRKFAFAALIAVLFVAVTAQSVFASPNTVTGQITETPVCNPQTGEFEGSFSVAWSVTQNADPGYTITNTDPSTPQVVQYPGEAGSKSFAFTLTQAQYYTQDVYGDWYWQYYNPVPKIPLVTGFEFFGWHYFPDIVKLPYVTGELKRDKLHSAGSLKDARTELVSGTVSLELGNCDEEVAPSAPTFRDPSCADGTVGLTVPNDDGVLYSTEGSATPGGSVTVTASAGEGYVLSEQSQTEWEHTYPAKAEGCISPPPPEPGCTFVGADKDGGKDKFGGTNDECAAGPDKPTTLVSTPPAVSAPPVVPPPVVNPPAVEKPKAKPKAKKSKKKSKAVKPKTVKSRTVKPKVKATPKVKASKRPRNTN